MMFFENIKNKIKNFWFLYQQIRKPDKYQWIESRNRLFLTKVRHFIYLILSIYLSISYMQYCVRRYGELYRRKWRGASLKDLDLSQYDKFYAHIIAYMIVIICVYLLTFFWRRIHMALYEWIGFIGVNAFMFLFFKNIWLMFPFEQMLFYYSVVGCTILNILIFYASNLVHYESGDEESDFDDGEEHEDSNYVQDIIVLERSVITERALIERFACHAFMKERLIQLEMPNEYDKYRLTDENIPDAFKFNIKGMLKGFQKFINSNSDNIDTAFETVWPFGLTVWIDWYETGEENYIRNRRQAIDKLSLIVETEFDYWDAPENEYIPFHHDFFEFYGHEFPIQDCVDIFLEFDLCVYPWNSRFRQHRMSASDYFKYQWWVSSEVPYFVKVSVICYRFLEEYFEQREIAKKTKAQLYFWDICLDFFTYPRSLSFWRIVNIVNFIWRIIKAFFWVLWVFIPKLVTQIGPFSFWYFVIKKSYKIPFLFFKFFKKIIFAIIGFLYREYIFHLFNFFFQLAIHIIIPIILPGLVVLYVIIMTLFNFSIIWKRVKPAGPYTFYNSIFNQNSLDWDEEWELRLYYYLKERIKTIKIFNEFEPALSKSKTLKEFRLWSTKKK